MGSRDRREVEAVLNYGGDTFGIRVAGSYEESDGYITNLATGNDELGAREATLARIALSWDPTDSFSLDYTLNYAGYDTVGPGQDHTTALGAATAAGFGAALGLTPLLPLPGDPIGDSYTVVNAIDPFTDRESYLHALTLEFDLGWATLKSISGYMDFESFWRSDVGLPSGFAECLVCVLASITFSEQWSQELLLNGSTDKFNWVTGLYYLKEEATDEGAFNLNIAAPALPVGTVFENTGGGQDLTSYAMFADGTYALTDRFRVNGGLRWTDDKKEATGTTRDIVLPNGFRIPGASLEHLEEKDDTVTWQVGLEFDLNEEIFTYLRIAEGYKAGGINNNTGSFYLPEELISYEIGAKGVVSENFSLSVSGFYSEYENIQVFINPPASPTADIINAASATIAGIDFDADWQLTDMFSIDAQFTWLAEADYDEFLVNDFGVDQDLSIGDEFYISSATEGVPGFQYGIHGRPDQYGLEVSLRFWECVTPDRTGGARCPPGRADPFYAPTPNLADGYQQMMRTGDMGDDGSGVELAQTVAADVKNIDAVMVSRVISPPEEFYKGVLVNRAGKRMIHEDAYAGQIALPMMQEPGLAGWLVLDSKQFWKGVRQLLQPVNMFSWFGLAQWSNVLFGKTRRARTLAELAAKCGIDNDGLEQTVHSVA